MLGLEKPPFELEPDPAFYVACEGIEQRLNMLMRLVRGREFIILVLGDNGSGKTTLLQRILDATGLVQRRIVIRAVHKTPTPQPDGLANLHNRPAWILQDEQTPIVLIDDAHELSRNELLYLLQNTVNPNDPQTTKRLVLFGEPILKKTLAEIRDAPEGKTPINTVYLPPLTLEEASIYLEGRMRNAGLKGKLPFNRSQVRKICRSTGGLPVKINQQAHRWLQNRYDRPSITRRLLAKTYLIGLLAVGIIIAILSVQFIREDDPGSKNSQSEPGATGGRRDAATQRPLASKTDTDRFPDVPDGSPVPADPAPAAPGALDPSRNPADRRPSANTATLPPPASRPAAARPDDTPRPTPAEGPASPPEAPSQSERQNQLTVHREDWLLSQDPAHFTIQIMGVRNESAVWKFAQNASLPEGFELAYYETRHNGSPWFPLVFGIFSDREKAGRTMKTMPQQVQALSPWIRSLASVQAAIRSRR